jgi:hypothetical protein
MLDLKTVQNTQSLSSFLRADVSRARRKFLERNTSSRFETFLSYTKHSATLKCTSMQLVELVCLHVNPSLDFEPCTSHVPPGPEIPKPSNSALSAQYACIWFKQIKQPNNIIWNPAKPTYHACVGFNLDLGTDYHGLEFPPPARLPSSHKLKMFSLTPLSSHLSSSLKRSR